MTKGRKISVLFLYRLFYNNINCSSLVKSKSIGSKLFKLSSLGLFIVLFVVIVYSCCGLLLGEIERERWGKDATSGKTPLVEGAKTLVSPVCMFGTGIFYFVAPVAH